MKGNIYIPQPCHEDWNKMTLAEKGRHCDICSKVVADFTRMKKEEVVEALAVSGDDVCGHINIDHLTASNKKQKIYFWFKGTFVPKVGYVAFAIFGLAAIFKKSAFAQNLEGRVVMMNGGAKYQAPLIDEKKITVVVVDEQNRPVPNALVKIIMNDAVVASVNTSTEGECSNTIEIESGGNTLINIEVDAYGYKHKIVKQIRIAKDNQTYRVKLDEEVIFMGKMKHIEEPEITPVDSIRVPEVKVNNEHPDLVLVNPFPNPLVKEELNTSSKYTSVETNVYIPRFEMDNGSLSFVTYPNPTTSDVTIQTKEDVSFDITIYNDLGVVVEQQLNQYQRTYISLEGNATGTYFAIIFINNKAVETHKIVLIR